METGKLQHLMRLRHPISGSSVCSVLRAVIISGSQDGQMRGPKVAPSHELGAGGVNDILTYDLWGEGGRRSHPSLPDPSDSPLPAPCALNKLGSLRQTQSLGPLCPTLPQGHFLWLPSLGPMAPHVRLLAFLNCVLCNLGPSQDVLEMHG